MSMPLTIFQLSAEDILAVTAAFNDSFDTIQKEFLYPPAYSPGLWLILMVSEKQEIIVHESPGTDVFAVSYMAIHEDGNFHTTNYILESSKFQEVFNTLRQKFPEN